MGMARESFIDNKYKTAESIQMMCSVLCPLTYRNGSSAVMRHGPKSKLAILLSPLLSGTFVASVVVVTTIRRRRTTPMAQAAVP
jgi:hypothetical protein